MSDYELTISPNYVKNWGLVEATREIFQNAIDQETTDKNNKMSYEYCTSSDTLVISSKQSSLEKSSLLFGNTTKADDKSTIGKFGEGYKLALMVLTRLGYKVTIHNYGMKEVWVPRIVKSRRYNSDILVVKVRKHIFKKVPDSNLSFKIEGVTYEDFDKIVEKTLFLQEAYRLIDSSFGEVLTDNKHLGSIFVNGLFVSKCNDEEIKFGYNLKPEHLEIDRDRSIINSFDLVWMTSQLWSKHRDREFVSKMIIDKVKDVRYLNNWSYNDVDLPDALFDAFQSKYGINSVPIIDDHDRALILKTNPSLKPVYTDDNTKSVIQKASFYKEVCNRSFKKEKTIEEDLEIFWKKYSYEFTSEMGLEFEKILEKCNKKGV